MSFRSIILDEHTRVFDNLICKLTYKIQIYFNKLLSFLDICKFTSFILIYL